ncbi:MAG: hypothetical protein GF405_08915, partial [Candidatus Eisenbacteria bacterium]|nr:hypothetical protein [Candidatus Eisenbacteria bacterium]
MHRLEARSGRGSRARVWCAALVLAAFVGAFLWGYLVHRMGIPPYDLVESGMTSAARFVRSLRAEKPRRARAGEGSGRGLSEAERREAEALTSISYLTGTMPAGAATGVTVFEKDRAQAGLNLVTSGHDSEVFLMDMEGEPLHIWSYAFEDIWPDYDLPKGTTETFRRAHLFPNGDLLAIFNWIGLVKLDRDSNLLWSYRGGCGNDLFVDDDGDIYVIGNEIKRIPRIHPRRETLENFLVVLSHEGEVLKRVSLLEAFERSAYAPVLDGMPDGGDILHTNTVEVLDGRLAGRSPAFKKGNVLLSMRNLNTIAVLDPDAGKIVWALSGRWREQHEPTVLDNGNVLLFNNKAGDGVSEVLEFDPFTQEIHWSYRGGPTREFFSEKAGTSQRLPNGNTLIVESDAGRAFEVTPEGTIVWEFVNPLRAAEDGELTATLFGLVR